MPPKYLLTVPCSRVKSREDLPRIISNLGGARDTVATLWVGEGAPLLKLPGEAVIGGFLFAREDNARVFAAPKIQDRRAAGSGLADHLVAEFWGAYFAIVLDRSKGRLSLFGDPAGLMPLFTTTTATHVAFTSDPVLFHLAGIRAVSVDFPATHRFLSRRELRARWTCLAGIEELEPGVQIDLHPDPPADRRLWCAAAFLPGRGPTDFEDARERLRHVATGTLAAWSRTLGPVAVAASGGVDSSLICAALANAGATFSCITVSTRDASGDERAYAGALASHLGVPIEERLYNPATFDPVVPASAGMATPARRSFVASLDRELLFAADKLGAATVLDGNGGDNVFCFLHSAAPIMDRFREEGPGPGLLATFLDMCQVTGCDVWTMLRAVARRAGRDDRKDPWPRDDRLLTDQVHMSDTVEPLLDWFYGGAAIQAGKRDHLALILRAQNQLNPVTSPARRFSPLLSQPLVEACLSVPTWLWFKGGINRSLARQAFADLLPPAVTQRRSKSGPDSFLRAAFDVHRDRLRAHLLEGLLAAHGVIDRTAVEAAFKTPVTAGGSLIYRLLDLGEAEAWCRSWSA